MVVTINSVLIWRLIPVRNMWCIQTIKDWSATSTIEKTNHLRPTRRRPVNVWNTSAITPSAGKKTMYTSGWPKNQNRWVHRSEPPSTSK